MLDKSFLEKVEALVLAASTSPIVKTEDGTEFAVTPLHRINRNPVLPEDKPEPDTLTIASLRSLVEYIEVNPDGLDLSKLIVHIVSPTEVALHGALMTETQQRLQYIGAKVVPASAAINAPQSYAHGGGRTEEVPSFGFTRWLDPETFIIGLQALFADTPDKQLILQLMSGIGSGAEIRIADDGVSQQTTAKVGVVRVGEVTVPNPVMLAPYRTFREITQPSSAFVFRLRPDAQAAVKASLYEADGGAWRDQAIEDIKQYFVNNLPDTSGPKPTIIG